MTTVTVESVLVRKISISVFSSHSSKKLSVWNQSGCSVSISSKHSCSWCQLSPCKCMTFAENCIDSIKQTIHLHVLWKVPAGNTTNKNRLWTAYIYKLCKFVQLSHFLILCIFYNQPLQHLSRYHFRLYLVLSQLQNTLLCSCSTKTIHKSSFPATSNLAPTPWINNWALSITSVSSSRAKENHSKSFALFFNWILMLLQMPSTFKLSVLAKKVTA